MNTPFLKRNRRKGWHKVLLGAAVLAFLSCSEPPHSDAERLNGLAYSWHYRDIDTVVCYARQVLEAGYSSKNERAEAYNHLAFVSIVRMDYELAARQLDSVRTLTDNQVELLVADIQQMRLCQRQSKNKDFYGYLEMAARRIKRIGEEGDMLSAHERGRMVYARSEYGIVTSTYYYYMGLEQQAGLALEGMDSERELMGDTAQYLAFLYNIGSGGIITTGTQEEINRQEFDYLTRCYIMAAEYGYPYWEANSMQALSEHLQTGEDRDYLIRENGRAVMLLNTENVADSLLAGNLAERSLRIFRQYGDIYQTAGSYRTLAGCYWQLHDYETSLECLDSALFLNPAIEQAPDLVSSIREQMSVVYSALNDKPNSDRNRNAYLDLQEQTRQDRYLESRAEQLNRSSSGLNMMIMAVIFLIVAVVLMLFIFNYLRRRRGKTDSIEHLLAPLERWKSENERRLNALSERYEEIEEEKQRSLLHIKKNKREHLGQRAKLSLVGSVTPFIDRILNELDRIASGQEPDEKKEERFAYVTELTDKINDYNALLTDWIQLRQGALNLHIESFPLQPLFDMVARGRMGFSLKGIALHVEPTDDCVKADRVLTLFMINTIADNARKFTPAGGTVTIRSAAKDNYVEISIEDTGQGMSTGQLEGLFKLNAEIKDTREEGHGFGLLNCRGIIEKYRKLSSLFSVCTIAAESTEGQGSRFFFRLPKGIQRLWLTAAWLVGAALAAIPAMAQDETSRYDTVTPANSYADKAYYANIRGDFAKTLLYADSARMCLNEEYRKYFPEGNDTMVALGSISAVPPEIKWFRDSLRIDFSIITDIRNESAVAALALHQWDVYRYNNKVYTQLYKEMSADNTLNSYVRIMQQSETNKNVAVIILVLLLLSIIPAYYVLYYRHQVHFRFCVERIGRINDILLSEVSEEEKLQQIQSFSTARYPSSLKSVVGEIISTLRHNVEANNVRRTHVELAGDELRRYQHEDGKLHVSNSVLDNCLSTLKHETMYFPARIRQLVDADERHLESIGEVAAYYKELYSLLSTQAMRQQEMIKMECKALPLETVFEEAFQVTAPQPPIRLLGDAEMLPYLFEILLRQSGEKTLSVVLAEKEGRYVEARLWMPRLENTEEECLNLFTPQSVQSIPYLLCRQIVRDTGETTNARGCGIRAEKNPAGGTDIIVTLVKAS